MQRVMEDTSYAASIELYLERCKGDVWTLEMKDRDQRDLELFEPLKHDLKKKICIGAVSHRTLQADRPEDVAGEIRKALKFIPPERLIVSSDCGFGRQGCNREIAFYKATAIAQGCNIVRRELGLPTTNVPAADPRLQVDSCAAPSLLVGFDPDVAELHQGRRRVPLRRPSCRRGAAARCGPRAGRPGQLGVLDDTRSPLRTTVRRSPSA